MTSTAPTVQRRRRYLQGAVLSSVLIGAVIPALAARPVIARNDPATRTSAERRDTRSHQIARVLASAPLLALPYGSPALLGDYPKTWPFASRQGVHSSETARVANLAYEQMLSGFFETLDPDDRATIELDARTARRFFSAEFLGRPTDRSGHEPLKVSTARIGLHSQRDAFLLTATMVGVCPTCEYPVSRAESVLVTFSDTGALVDKLTVSYRQWSDLGSTSTFFHIDAAGTIHVKRFSDDELAAQFLGSDRWTLQADGHFKKSSR